MNNAQMHTAVDVGVNQLNSHLYRKLSRDVKDVVLNNVILSTALSAIRPVETTQLSRNNTDRTPGDVSSISTLFNIQVLQQQENATEFDEEYSIFKLPTYPTNKQNSGLLYHAHKYYIIEKGDLSWETLVNIPVIEGNVHTIILPLFNSVGTNTIPLNTKFVYQITEVGEYNWENVGVHNAFKGCVFSPNQDITITADTNCEVQTIAAYPSLDGSDTAWDNAVVYKVDNYNVLQHSKLRLMLSSFSFSRGRVDRTEAYIIINAGKDDLTPYGGSSTYSAGDTFVASTTTKLNLTQGTTIAHISYVESNIVQYSNEADLYNLSMISNSHNPISILGDGEIRVLTNKKFTVLRAELTYIRYPNTMNTEYNLPCNLPESVHGVIVDRAVSKILASNGSQRYQAVKTEEAVEQKTHRF